MCVFILIVISNAKKYNENKLLNFSGALRLRAHEFKRAIDKMISYFKIQKLSR